MDYNEFCKWIYKKLGINLSAYKQEQLSRRINSLISRIGVRSLEEYTKLIQNNPEHKQKFLDFITINVTEFFRNPELFNELENELKNQLLRSKRNLKIWSAACSNGCEPYSVAIILKNLDPDRKHNILATDIDSSILEKAKLGEFIAPEVKNVKNIDLNKYFTKVHDKYIIDNSIKKYIEFKKHDLVLGRYNDGFDLILCRNVVIYFNNEVKNEIYKNFSKSLKKGGLLFIGATESIYNYKEYGFEKASTFIYRKL